MHNLMQKYGGQLTKRHLIKMVEHLVKDAVKACEKEDPKYIEYLEQAKEIIEDYLSEMQSGGMQQGAGYHQMKGQYNPSEPNNWIYPIFRGQGGGQGQQGGGGSSQGGGTSR